MALIANIHPPPEHELFKIQYVCVAPTVGKLIQYAPSVVIPSVDNRYDALGAALCAVEPFNDEIVVLSSFDVIPSPLVKDI